MFNNSSGVHRPPAPIFNLPKRPRHALVSDPCEGGQFMGHVRNNGPYPGTSFGPTNTGRQTGSWNTVNAHNSSSDLVPPKPRQPLHQSRSQNIPQTRMCIADAPTLPRPNQFQNNIGQSKSMTMPYSQQSNPRQSFGRENQASTVRARGAPNSNQWNYQTFKQTGNLPVQTRRPGFLDVGPSQSRGVNQVRHQTPTMQTSSHTGDQAFSTRAYNRSQRQQSNFTNSYSKPTTSPHSAISGKSTSNHHSQKPVQDKSLHVLTAMINSLRQWTKTPDSIPLLIELYGIVDSAVTMNDSTQGKEFMLKDETGILSCVFFEIDRSLGRLTRGQWYRCMGTYDPKQDKFKCVSVRPASPAERGLAKTASKICEQKMRSMVSGLREA